MNLDELQGDFELGDIADIDVDTYGEIMPPKNGKIALIDADTIAYTACLATEVEQDVLPRDFYNDDEWEAIVSSPEYNPETGMLWIAQPELALEKAKEKIQRILDRTGCVDVELHFTGGKSNFRYFIYPQYKATRTARRPAGLNELKVMLCEEYNGTIHTDFEADDVVVYKLKAESEKYILCAIDKDVLNSVEGKHYNYYESAVYGIDMKWVETDRYTSIIWPFLQVLTGDTSDNIRGLAGIGPAKARKILAGCLSFEELWQAVSAAYVKAGRSEDEALLNMNLVNMHLLKDYKIKLLTKEDFMSGEKLW